jgi:hypothetical protein
MSTPTTWNSGASTDANNAANYSAGLPADAVVTLDATSVVNWIFTANMSVESITISAAYTGVVTMTGFTLTCSLGFSDDGITGAHTYATSITCNGASSTFHVGAGVASVASTSTALILNGTTAMVLDDDKGIIMKSLTLGALAVVTRSGAASTGIFQNSAPTLIFTNGGTFTNNAVLSNYYTGNCDFISILAGNPTINGTGAIRFRILTDGITCNLPAFTYTGTGNVLISDATTGTTGWTVNLTGNLACTSANLQLAVSFAGSSGTINLSTYTVGASTISYGSSNATGQATLNFGSAIITTGAVNSTLFNSGTNNVNLQTSTWAVSGNLTFPSTHAVDPGSSLATITGTSTVTSNGKSFFDLTINSGANTVTLADALILAAAGDLTLTAGTLNLSTFNLTVGGNTAVNGTSTLNATASTCSFAGNYTTAAGSTITINAATNYTFTAAAIVTTNGKALPQCTFNAAFSLNDSCTITRLIWGVDGITGTFEATQTFTLTNLAAANLSGAAGLLNAFRSSVPGTQYTLAIPNIVTLQYVNPQDADLAGGFQITVNDGTSLNGGNNDVNWIWPVVVPATGGKGEGGASRCYIAGAAIGI